MVPTIEWHGNQVRMVDQRKIPAGIHWYICRGYKDVIAAIQKMVIRGAPAIGIAAAMGLALGANSVRTKSLSIFKKRFDAMSGEMLDARPTAVNLQWAVERMSKTVEKMGGSSIKRIKSALKQESINILSEDIECNRRIGKNGLRLIHLGATILTHCNAGALATGGYGTALGVIRAAHENEKNIKVIADETRPWLQGIRLTAFELMQDGIPVSVIVDSAAGHLMHQKKIDMVITGADRIAANGDTANKIGTYQLAVLARANNIPFYVAAPLSTIDPTIENGDMIPLEQRGREEISRFGKQDIGPRGLNILNPSFDITPARYIAAIITEKDVIYPPLRSGITRLLKD